MVFVKVRETYDLHTIPNKLSIIGVHTPSSNIIKKEYPGLLMQCKAYRPVSVDIRCACASMLPADPLQVGTESGEVAPEDLFNPILYKAITNKGLSQLEAFVAGNGLGTSSVVSGPSANAINSGITADDFNIYYGLLSDTNSWAHANPQSGFSMSSIKPLVFEMVSIIGDSAPFNSDYDLVGPYGPDTDGNKTSVPDMTFRGNSKPMPYLNCTSYTAVNNGAAGVQNAGFTGAPFNAELDVPAPKIYCAAIVVPPSRLHKLYYRMVVEWTLEFTGIRSLTEITNWSGLSAFGSLTHYTTYSYESAKAAMGLTGEQDVLSEDTSMVTTSDGTEIHKVM